MRALRLFLSVSRAPGTRLHCTRPGEFIAQTSTLWCMLMMPEHRLVALARVPGPPAHQPFLTPHIFLFASSHPLCCCYYHLPQSSSFVLFHCTLSKLEGGGVVTPEALGWLVSEWEHQARRLLLFLWHHTLVFII